MCAGRVLFGRSVECTRHKAKVDRACKTLRPSVVRDQHQLTTDLHVLRRKMSTWIEEKIRVPVRTQERVALLLNFLVLALTLFLAWTNDTSKEAAWTLIAWSILMLFYDARVEWEKPPVMTAEQENQRAEEMKAQAAAKVAAGKRVMPQPQLV